MTGPSGGTRRHRDPIRGRYIAVFGMSVLKDGADAWQDPEFLESIAQRATRATLGEGQKLTINARVITP